MNIFQIKMPIDISLAIEKKVRLLDDDREPGHLVSPGDVITRDQGYMHGHGTYMEQDVFFATVAGVVECQ